MEFGSSLFWGGGECIIQVLIQVGALRIVRGKGVRVVEIACGSVNFLDPHPLPSPTQARSDWVSVTCHRGSWLASCTHLPQKQCVLCNLEWPKAERSGRPRLAAGLGWGPGGWVLWGTRTFLRGEGGCKRSTY